MFCIFLLTTFDFVFFDKSIALIVATSRSIVILPVSKTHPAEVMMANLTLHMVAAGVLLYVSPTLLVGALLSVHKNPVDILTLRRVFLFPFFDHDTRGRAVSFMTALVAEVVATEALHSVRQRV